MANIGHVGTDSGPVGTSLGPSGTNMRSLDDPYIASRDQYLAVDN